MPATKKVLVTDLASDVGEDALRRVFETFGPVTAIKLRGQPQKRYAFIVFVAEQAAAEAVEAISGRDGVQNSIRDAIGRSARVSLVHQAAPVPLVPQTRGAESPLSRTSKLVWAAEQFASRTSGPASGPTSGLRVNQQFLFTGTLDDRVFIAAFEDVRKRHESLRTTFHERDGIPYQRVHPCIPLDTEIPDLTQLSESDRTDELQRLRASFFQRPIDLASDYSIRLQPVRVSREQFLVLLATHHILFDRASYAIFWRDLIAFYNARLTGTEASLPPMDVHFADYALWEEKWPPQSVLDNQLQYWKSQLSGIAFGAGQFPLVTHRPPASGPASFVRRVVDVEFKNALSALARRLGATEYAVRVAALRLILVRFTGDTDICIGCPVAMRREPAVRHLIGFIGSMIALRTALSPTSSFAELVAVENKNIFHGIRHSDIGIERVIRELTTWHKPGVHALYQTILSEGADEGPAEAGTMLGIENIQWLPPDTFTLDDNSLTILVRPSAERLIFVFQYRVDLVRRAVIEQLAAEYLRLLHKLAENPDARVGPLLADIRVLSDADRNALLARGSRTHQAPAREPDAVQMFTQRVRERPEASALLVAGRSVCYRELDERSSGLARALTERGFGREHRVGILVERSEHTVVAMLGVLKSGAAFLVLDSELPAARLHYMVEDAKIHTIVVDTRSAAYYPATDMPVLVIEECASHQALTAPEPYITPGIELSASQSTTSLAYLFYTSGSAGRPKGVAIEQRSLTNFVHRAIDDLGWTPSDRILGVTTVSFDPVLLELLVPLCVGATIVMATHSHIVDPYRLRRLLEESDATVMQATPTSWKMLLDTGWVPSPDLQILCGGEALTRELADRLAGGRALWNLYGPTECTVWCSWRPISPGQPIALAAAIAGSACYILGPDLEPVPEGAAGELFIGGAGVARAYWNRPGLTAASFLPDPFSSVPGARMYRSGDLGRWTPEGTIEFLGRVDSQVKIRGHRIELGEIEAQLVRHRAVKDAVVMAYGHGDRARLVAYVVHREHAGTNREANPGTKLNAAALRTHLQLSLPGYMIPGAFVIVGAIPLTSSGKVDRKRLPEPTEADFARHRFASPRTDIERRLVTIFCEVLRVDRVGIHDDFLAIGGNSLLAIQLTARIASELARTVSIQELLDRRTVARLAQAMAPTLSKSDPARDHERAHQRLQDLPASHLATVDLTPCHRTSAPATTMQRANYYCNFWPVMTHLELKGTVEPAVLRRSLESLIRRHSVLRTTYRETPAGLLQEISASPDRSMLEWHQEDISGLGEQARERRVAAMHAHLWGRSFDLSRLPIVRAAVLSAAPERHHLMIAVSHTALDMAGMMPFYAELCSTYADFLAGVNEVRPEPALHYIDLADYLDRFAASPDGERMRAYWQQRLAGARAVQVPNDFPRAQLDRLRDTRPMGLASAPCHWLSARTDAPTRAGLARLATEHRATMPMVLLAALAAHLQRTTGQTDMCFYMTFDLRHRPELTQMLGMVANGLVARIDARPENQPDSRPNRGFADLLARTRTEMLAAYRNGLAPIMDDVPHQLRRINFNFTRIPRIDQELDFAPGVRAVFHPASYDGGRTPFDVLYALIDDGQHIALSSMWNQQLFRLDTGRTFIEGYMSLLSELAA